MLFSTSLDAPDALVTRDQEFVEASLLYHNITDVIAFFRPGKTPSPDLFALYGEELVIVIYLGWIGLTLGMYAMIATRRHRSFGPWVWLAVFFFVFSLGPYLNMNGQMVEISGRRIPLPVPAFVRCSSFVLADFAPISFCGWGEFGHQSGCRPWCRHMTRNTGSGRRLLLVTSLSALALVGFRYGSPATIPVPTSDAVIPLAYQEMAQDPEEGAVLDLPLTVPNLERAVYVWYQTEHGRPVPWGLHDPMPETLLKNRLTATLIRMEAHQRNFCLRACRS